MSYVGNVPKSGGVRPALKAADLRPEPADIPDECWLTMGGADVSLPEAWFTALRRARRLFVRRYRRLPDELVFDGREAERVADLPQMRRHVEAWRKAVGRSHVLECGLPDRLWGMHVVVQ